jgi:hypothetical protein
MQPIARALVVGGFMRPAPPGQQHVNTGPLNRIWGELPPARGWGNLQITPRRLGASTFDPSYRSSAPATDGNSVFRSPLP